MGKNFRKNRKEIAKVEKNCKNFGEIFQKIVEIFQKIVEIFQKIVEIFQKNCKKFQKNSGKPPKIFQNLSLLPINLRATLKVFFAHCLTRSLSHKIILFLLLLSFLPNNSSDFSFRCQKTLNFSERVYLCLSLL